MTEDTATAKQVAAYLHTTEAGLAMMRYRGTGPKFIKEDPAKSSIAGPTFRRT